MCRTVEIANIRDRIGRIEILLVPIHFACSRPLSQFLTRTAELLLREESLPLPSRHKDPTILDKYTYVLSLNDRFAYSAAEAA